MSLEGWPNRPHVEQCPICGSNHIYSMSCIDLSGPIPQYPKEQCLRCRNCNHSWFCECKECKMEEIPTPECDKFHAIADKSQTVGEFCEWLRAEYGIVLPKSINDLLAQFFEIDQDQLEWEKQEILAQLRKDQG